PSDAGKRLRLGSAAGAAFQVRLQSHALLGTELVQGMSTQQLSPLATALSRHSQSPRGLLAKLEGRNRRGSSPFLRERPAPRQPRRRGGRGSRSRPGHGGADRRSAASPPPPARRS